MARCTSSPFFIFFVSALLSSATQVASFKTHLIHRDAIASPLYRSFRSPRERLSEAWKRSVARSGVVKRKAVGVSRVHAADYGYGAEYLMSFSLGTPPQTFVAVADTGSSLVWLQCSPCPNCTDPHGPIFHPLRSSTYHTLPCNNTLCQLLNKMDAADTAPNLQQCSENCTFQYLYGDLSNALGVLSVETVKLERSVNLPSFVFGCAHHSQNDFFVPGLVGLGPRPYSFTSQLASTFGGHTFSYCLVGLHQSLNKTSPMFFGELPRFQSALNMKYTALLNSRNNMSSFYYVALKGLSLGAQRLHMPANVFDFDFQTSGGSILDTGTTFMMLPASAYNVVIKALRSMVPYPREKMGSGEYKGLWCYNISGVRNPVFPTFTLHFENVDLDLPPANTFVKVSRSAVCLAISSSGSMFADDVNITIIGNIAQQNFHVHMDVQNERVGFAAGDCGQFLS